MTEEQQIEIWRAQFESTVNDKRLLSKFPSGNYNWESTEWMWAGFQRARRTMPAIELPEFFDDPDGCQLFSGSVTGAIEAAGYKYKIKL